MGRRMENHEKDSKDRVSLDEHLKRKISFDLDRLDELSEKGEYHKCLKRLDAMQDLVSRTEDIQLMLHFFLLRGGVKGQLFHYQYAINDLDHVLDLTRENDFPEYRFKAHLKKGEIYRNSGQLDKELKYYLEALKIAESENNDQYRMEILMPLAERAFRTGDIDESEKLTYEIIDLARRLENEEVVALTLNNLGVLYNQREKPEKALKAFEEAADFFVKNGNKRGLSFAYNNIGMIHHHAGDFSSARDYYEKTVSLKQDIGDSVGLGHSQLNLGLNYLEMKEFDKALEMFESCDRNSSQNNNMELHVRVVDSYGEYYYEFGRKMLDAGDVKMAKEAFQNSYEYFQRSKKLMLTMFNRDSSNKIAELQAQFDVNRKEQEKEIYRLKNVELASRKEELDQLVETLKKREEELQEAVDSRDTFLSILAHDLRGQLSHVIGACEVMLLGWESLDAGQIRSYLEKMYQEAGTLSELLNNLLGWAQTQKDGVHPEPVEIDFPEFSAKLMQLFQQATSRKGVIIRQQIPDNLLLFFDPQILNTVLRNLISNAIKFTPAGGFVTLQATSAEDGMRITVADTGIGMTPEELEALMNDTKRQSRPGTNHEIGTGLGMKLCRELVSHTRARLEAKSQPDAGSAFTLFIPTSA